MKLTARIIQELQKHGTDIDAWAGAHSIKIIVRLDHRTGEPCEVNAQPEYKYPVRNNS